MSKIELKTFFLVISGLSLFFVRDFTSLLNLKVFAEGTHTVNATIKINVCGDSVKENPEDCDIGDFGSLTCNDYGFNSGSLSCDISCSVVTTACFNTSADSGDGDNSDSSSSSESNNEITDSTSDQTGTNDSSKLSFETIVRAFPIALLSTFDIDRSGTIETGEVPDLIRAWVNDWRDRIAKDIQDITELSGNNEISSLCDVNKDSTCSIVDFSVMLYYL
ncbi:hypothetical protein HYV31_03595 [candidate division WWE3 bacterium]|nr:hypothetical protein [candidate division WWE3 bacterium]